MDAVKFLMERKRMCDSYGVNNKSCGNCELGKNHCCYTHNTEEMAIKAIEVVEQWSKEHPAKTRASEFMKQFPNAVINLADNLPKIYPCTLDTTIREKLCKGNFSCTECREKYWLEEIE